MWGALHSRRRGLTFNLAKIPLIYSVSYFNLGGLGALFGEPKPTKTPRGDGTELYRRLHAVNSRFVASLVVHLCAVKKNVIVASQLYDVADEGYSSQ